MTMLAEFARRAVSHPHTASFVKRAVAIQNDEGTKIEVPTWGVVVVYLTIMVGSVALSLVCSPYLTNIVAPYRNAHHKAFY